VWSDAFTACEGMSMHGSGPRCFRAVHFTPKVLQLALTLIARGCRAMSRHAVRSNLLHPPHMFPTANARTP
jgi:hypothetical protein